MATNEFTQKMEEQSNENLLDILKNRDKYQENAKNAAITAAIKRNLILDELELEERYPLIKKSNPEEIETTKGFLEFKNKISTIFLISIVSICWIFFTQLPSHDKNLGAYWIPISLLIMTFFCYKNYSKLFANIIICSAAILLVTTIISIISSL